MYDVAVVGAGPGGSTAAYHLARAGLRTVLLEKEKMPRYKPCGGGLTAKVGRILDFDFFSSTIEDTITDVSIAYRDERFRVRYPEALAWTVMRDKFDLSLAERASKAGAELRQAQPVSQVNIDRAGASITTPSETLHAKVVVGADGMNGVVRRATGFPGHSHVAAALEAEMEAPSSALEQWHGALHVDFGAIGRGYGWIFPKAEHLSVGIGAFLTKNQKVNLRAELKHYLQAEPSLKKAKEMFARGYRIPIAEPSARYDRPGVVLIGDAAGLVDPFTAEGIYYAIRSGQIAAEEIARAFSRGDADLTSYTHRIREEFISNFRTSMLFAQLLYRVPHLAFRVFRRSQAAREAALKILAGSDTYSRILTGLAKTYAKAVLQVA